MTPNLLSTTEPRSRARRRPPSRAGEPLFRRLDACVRGLEPEIVEFTEALVAVASENPPGTAYPECVQLIEARLRALGLDVEHVPFRPRRGERDRSGAAVLLSSVGTGKRTLYFSGHYDVVPVSTPGQCQAVRRGNALFGRGTADMKGGVAAMLYAAVALQRVGAPLDGRVGLVFVPDEETGGRRGSEHLARLGRLGRGGIGMLTPEPTSGIVWNASRGAVTLRVTVHGRQAHIGLMHQGHNAFDDAIRVVEALKALARRVGRRRTRFHLTPSEARRSLMLIGGRVEAGSNFNVVPDTCSFTVDRRMNPEEDMATEREVLLGVLDRMRRQGIDLDVEVLQDAQPSGVSEDTPLGRALREHIRAVTGRPARFEMCPALLEIRFYAQQGMPAYAYGPGPLSVAHGPREFVRVDRLVECAAIYARTAASVLAPA